MSNFLHLIRVKLLEEEETEKFDTQAFAVNSTARRISLVPSSSRSSLIVPRSSRTSFIEPSSTRSSIVCTPFNPTSVPRNPQTVLDELKVSLRQKVIETKRESLSCMNDFEILYRSLTTTQTINYEDFMEAAKNAPISTQRFFTAKNFLMFPKDKRGGILVESFLRFVQRSIDVEIVCLQLMTHVKENTLGFINEQELERFILERIPEIGACEDLPESFYPYYVFTASRRFLFFLDSRRTRRISVKKLAHSAVMEELLFLQRISHHVDTVDPQLLANQVASNWFSGGNALRVFSLYVELDKDQNGMISQEELLAFTGPPNEQVQLSRTAIQRIFEENITYQPMVMDYKTFLDLYLALEYKSTVEAITYFWRVLDIDKCGRLTPTAIKYFYSDIYDSLRATGYEAPSVDNVIVEIYDILGVYAEYPTFQRFVQSDQGHTVVSMLLDVNGFWQYDNRESLMQQQNLSSVDVEQDTIDTVYDNNYASYDEDEN